MLNQSKVDTMNFTQAQLNAIIAQAVSQALAVSQAAPVAPVAPVLEAAQASIKTANAHAAFVAPVRIVSPVQTANDANDANVIIVKFGLKDGRAHLPARMFDASLSCVINNAVYTVAKAGERSKASAASFGAIAGDNVRFMRIGGNQFVSIVEASTQAAFVAPVAPVLVAPVATPANAKQAAQAQAAHAAQVKQAAQAQAAHAAFASPVQVAPIAETIEAKAARKQAQADAKAAQALVDLSGFFDAVANVVKAQAVTIINANYEAGDVRRNMTRTQRKAFNQTAFRSGLSLVDAANAVSNRVYNVPSSVK